MFHLINDDHDAIFMTILVRSHGQIHVYVKHPVHEPILINGGNGVTLDLVVEPEDVEPLDVSEPNRYTPSEPKLAYDSYYNGQGYFCSSDSNDDDKFYDGDNDFDGHQYFYEGDRDDRDGRDCGVDDEGGWDGSHDKSGKEPIVEEPQEGGAVTTDSNDSNGDSDVEGARQMNPNQRYVGEDSSDSWDTEVVVQLPYQMSTGVMNSDYSSEELLSLTESSFDSDDDNDSEGDGDDTSDRGHVDNVTKENRFLVFRLVFYLEHIRFKKNMLLISTK
nr:hypothetical protein CFP56_18622 [Quercus suber]